MGDLETAAVEGEVGDFKAMLIHQIAKTLGHKISERRLQVELPLTFAGLLPPPQASANSAYCLLAS